MAPRFRAEQFFEAQRVAVIVVIVATPAEQPVARFPVARDRSAIVLVDFKPYRPAASPLRGVFRRRKKERPDAAPADMGSHRDGVKPSMLRTRRIEDKGITRQLAVRLRDRHRRAGRREEAAKASPRQDIGRKDGLFEGDERIDIANPAAAEFCRRRRSRRSIHDTHPLSRHAPLAPLCTSFAPAPGKPHRGPDL